MGTTGLVLTEKVEADDDGTDDRRFVVIGDAIVDVLARVDAALEAGVVDEQPERAS